MSGNLKELNEFDYLYRKYFRRLYLFAITIVKDSCTAEDIVQDSFIKVWQGREHIDAKTFKSYLFTSVRNRCLNHQRDLFLKRQKVNELSELAYFEEIYRIDFIRDKPYTVFEQELKMQIEGVLATLKPDCRKVFELSRYEGLKNREIAEKLGVSIKTVERHISKAIQVLKEHFSNQVTMLFIVDLLFELF